MFEFLIKIVGRICMLVLVTQEILLLCKRENDYSYLH
jgi:hypothetical protein